jgi:hypothetical protein
MDCANEHFAKTFNLWQFGQFGFYQLRDLGHDLPSHHQFWQEVFTLFVPLADDIHGFPGCIQDHVGFRSVFYHLIDNVEGLFLFHVSDGIDKLF